MRTHIRANLISWSYKRPLHQKAGRNVERCKRNTNEEGLSKASERGQRTRRNHVRFIVSLKRETEERPRKGGGEREREMENERGRESVELHAAEWLQ